MFDSSRFLTRLTKGVSVFALSVVLGGLPLTPAFAAPAELGKFGYWTAYKMADGNHNVCYMSITAKAPEAKGAAKKAKRGNVVLMITHRPGENTTDVVSYSAGTKFKAATDVNINIGSKQFNLFTQNDTAWSRDSATDHALALAIRSAASLAISGTSVAGTPIADTVALKGADAAYTAMSKACSVQIPGLPKAAPVKKEAPAKAKAEPAAKKPVAKKETAKAATAPKTVKKKEAAPKGGVPSSADLKKLLSE